MSLEQNPTHAETPQTGPYLKDQALSDSESLNNNDVKRFGLIPDSRLCDPAGSGTRISSGSTRKMLRSTGRLKSLRVIGRVKARAKVRRRVWLLKCIR